MSSDAQLAKPLFASHVHLAAPPARFTESIAVSIFHDTATLRPVPITDRT